MRFVHPELLWLLLALPVLALAGWWLASRQRRALERFAGGEEGLRRFTAEISTHRRTAKLLLLCLGLGCIVLAAARPQWGTRLETIAREGLDVVIVLDTSLSMAAEDIAPSRLGQATHGVDRLLEALEGNRLSLITFAGAPTVVSPLTLDHAALRLFLETVRAEAMQVPGTALADALRLGARTFGVESDRDDERGRALVLFSDGEDHEGEIEDAIPVLQDAGVRVYAVGCGTSRGAPIPLEDETGTASGYKKDREDKVVTTRLDETTLERLALETGGRYYRATPSDVEIGEIVKALTSMDARQFGSVLRTRYEERFQIPLIVGLALLLAETLLGDRKKPSPAAEEVLS
ncbi:MAG: VWA domain-containing protein [Planctomycetes bacterium]|nr:VWA domain-containing protein [Planctomycetota bacterium]